MSRVPLPHPTLGENYRSRPMGQQDAPKHAVTPPKGRPTRSRTPQREGRVFDARAQWIAAIGLLMLAMAILFVTLG